MHNQILNCQVAGPKVNQKESVDKVLESAQNRKFNHSSHSSFRKVSRRPSELGHKKAETNAEVGRANLNVLLFPSISTINTLKAQEAAKIDQVLGHVNQLRSGPSEAAAAYQQLQRQDSAMSRRSSNLRRTG